MPRGECDETVSGVAALNKPVANMAASVRQRLLNLARERREDFGLVLTKYGLERVLYRVSKSNHRDLFVLKGALLFELWTEQRYRPTRDADFLARGQNSPERFATIFKEISHADVDDDGIRFDTATEAILFISSIGGLLIFRRGDNCAREAVLALLALA